MTTPTPTKKRVVKTPFDQLREVMERHWCQPLGGKSTFDAEQLASIKAMAAELPLSDIEEDVPEPPKTDGELFEQAMLASRVDCGKAITHDWNKSAAEFLRLRAERDGDKGEPLEVTEKLWEDWWYESRGKANMTAAMIARINAHRGVRPLPQIPQVTESVWLDALIAWQQAKGFPVGNVRAVNILNAELAKAAGKDGGQ